MSHARKQIVFTNVIELYSLTILFIDYFSNIFQCHFALLFFVHHFLSIILQRSMFLYVLGNKATKCTNTHTCARACHYIATHTYLTEFYPDVSPSILHDVLLNFNKNNKSQNSKSIKFIELYSLFLNM